MISPRSAVFWLWLVWFSTWWLAAFWASRAAKRPRPGPGDFHRVFASVGFGLLFLPGFLAIGGRAAPAWLSRPLLGEGPLARWLLVGLVIASFGFCWWARLHLGRLWSGFTTVKADHHIVDTGPYGLVRHPIYTGVIAAALFTAILEASLAGVLGFALIGLGFWMTARAEERFLGETLGAEAYGAYRARVGMLLPGLG